MAQQTRTDGSTEQKFTAAVDASGVATELERENALYNLAEGHEVTLVYDSPYTSSEETEFTGTVQRTGVSASGYLATYEVQQGEDIRRVNAQGDVVNGENRSVGDLVRVEAERPQEITEMLEDRVAEQEAEDSEDDEDDDGEGRLMTDGGTEQKMDYERVCELIEDGTNTNQAITEALDSSVGHVGRVLKRWTEEGKLAREKNGHAYEYHVPSEDEQQAQQQAHQPAQVVQAPASTGAQASAQQGGDALRAPVDRDYDWGSRVPEQDETPEYISHNGEKQEIRLEIQAIRQWVEQVKDDLREDLGEDPTPEQVTSECRRRENADDEYAPRLPRYMVDGPTGCGKTTLATSLAAEYEVPVIEVQFTYDMSPAELLGSPQLVGGNTVWEDGGLTQALLASREGPVVVVLDEVPRARPEVHSTLMDALDHRARVKLTGRGHEEIQGIPHNLITVATANLGDEYQHFEMDPAHKRRLGDRHSVDYLGRNYPHREADLVSERTGCPDRLADLLVETANQVRERADDPTSDVRFGVPTAAIIDWAQKARSLAAHDLEGVEGVENPVVKAGESTVVRRWYDGNQAEADTVRQIVKDHLDGCPYNGEDLAAWAGEQEYVVCAAGCGYQAPVEQAKEDGALDFMECQDCDSHVERKTSQEMQDEDLL